MIYTEYTYIAFYFVISFLLCLLIFIFSYLLVFQNPETEKMSAYECGFEPYEGARKKFDVKFYIYAMLFVIFDIETMFLIPWCISLSKINYIGFWVMVDFLFELSLGFIYIWIAGGLMWRTNHG